MNILLASWPFFVSALCAALMGFAIQRGATCMVAAVDEAVTRRRFTRLAAMVGASLWVLVGLLVVQAAGALPRMPAGYALTAWTVVGGALLGLGAFVGRACVFGAIARFGNGEWSYLMVPIGFYVGCATVAPLFMPAMPQLLPRGSAVFGVGAWGAPAIALVLAAAIVGARRAAPRAGHSGASRRPSADLQAAAPARASAAVLATTSSATMAARLGFTARVWSPGAATAVIGITFLVMMLLVGPWAYTEALSDVARRMPHDLVSRGLLMFALFAGAFVGGLTARRFASNPVTPSRLARCFASGVLMGWGSLLIPGGNDGLILVGMPLLFPYAWIAMASMASAIAVAMIATRPRADAKGDAVAGPAGRMS